MHVWVFMTLVTTLVLCSRSEDSLMSVLVRRVHVVFSMLHQLTSRKDGIETTPLNAGTQVLGHYAACEPQS